jgi:putative intracellular protease/amidase
MIDTEPMSREQIGQLLTDAAHLLDGLHPVDVLTLAGFLAGSALQCWGEGPHRDTLVRGFVANLLDQLGVTADNVVVH